MCGIFAYTGKKEAVPEVLQGLEKLEYRGYDSAGIGVIKDKGQLKVIKVVGYISRLNQKVFTNSSVYRGHLAIGHTRWATHGQVNTKNAHPQTDCLGKIAVVHNGVIENFQELKQSLSKKHSFVSQTDTEVIAHLLEDYLSKGMSFRRAFQNTLSSLVGAWAVAVVDAKLPTDLWLGRFSSPLAIGLAKNGVYVSSDARAFPPSVSKVIFLEDKQLTRINIHRTRKVEIFDLDGQKIDYHLVNKGLIDELNLEKKGYQHFMLKEIFDQPQVIRRGLQGRVDFGKQEVILGGLASVSQKIKEKRKVGLVACGTSYNAALIAKLFGQGGLDLSVWSENSSDYGRLNIDKEKLNQSSVFYVSQSGETADTLESLKLIKKSSQALNLGIVNVVGSSLARQVEAGVYTRAGVEVGVAATKSFTSQILALYLALIYLHDSYNFTNFKRKTFFNELRKLDEYLRKILDSHLEIKKISKELVGFKNFMFLGRHLAYPLALEGALKLKEVSYRFSYGDFLGGLKHGPLALVDRDVVFVVIVFSQDPDLAKSLSNVYEIVSRGGQVLLISDLPRQKLPRQVKWFVPLPRLKSLWLMPFLTAPVIQLLAYYLALALGREIDKPRYLAKSVTVI